ncbi:MAG: aspartate aminotransferase family protein [Flavobacteriaceae bacterium]
MNIEPRANMPRLENYWMPFTANRQFKSTPRLLTGASGMYYTDIDGRQVLDGTAGLWCVNAGHARKEIASAVAHQLETLDYAPSFQMGHPLAFEVAERLARIAPEGLNRVFFTNSGSESADTALKIALAYYRAKNDAARVRVIGRERGYHGVGFGGISVGGLVANRKVFTSALLPGSEHIRHTHDAKRNAFSKGQPEHGAEFADDLERLIALHGAETIACVMVEPVAGSTGVLVPPKGYLERLRELCTKHGILLIFDEVITGFGRLGAPFAAGRFGVVPDIITTAKGLTNGVVPMGAVFVKQEIHDALMTGPESIIEFFHGYTYSGSPSACAAAIATQDIYQREGLFERAASLEPYWQEAVHSLKGTKHVIDIRNLGLVAGIELESRADGVGKRAYEVFVRCFNAGLMVRYTGDTLAMSPPLIIEKEEIDRLVNTLGEIIPAVD